MSTITVVLAPDGPAAGVADRLADLSAAGLVGRFVWAGASQMALPDPAATVVEGGRRTTVSLRSWAAGKDNRDVRRVRLVVIVPLGGEDPVPPELEQRLFDVFQGGGGSGAITSIRCLITRPGDRAPSATLARAGWHNVLVSPEDAQGPGRQNIELTTTSADAVDVGKYAAPVVAGIAGLWTGVDRSPLDDVRYPVQPRVRAARGFYRRVDADAIEAELRTRVLSTQAPLPLPRDHLGPTEHVPDQRRACSDMADALWHRHRHQLIGERVRPRKTPPTQTGPLAALKQLFRYIWVALWNLPGDFIQSVANRQSVLTAQRVHTLVYGGGDSAYSVVVNGYDETGLPASWRTVDQALEHLGQRLEATDRNQPPVRPDLRQLWDDYVSGALTLIDSGERGMPPATVGANRAVLRSVSDCVPDPSHDFGPVPPHIAERTGVAGIMPGDVLQGMSLYDQLNSARMRADFGRDSGQTAQALNEWAAQHDATYSVQVGRRLADGLLGVVADIQRYLGLLQRAAQENDQPAGDEKRSRWAIRLLGVLAVLGIVGGPVLGGLGLVRWPLAVVIAVVPLLAWLVYVLLAFARAKQRAFQALNRRRTLLDEVDAAASNLGQAITDLHRLTEAYEQYLVWTRILGVVLRAPFGEPRTGTRTRVAPVRGMPFSTAIAHADVDPESLGQAVAALRSEVFPRGWLSDAWAAQLRGAARRLGHYDLMQRAPGEITNLQLTDLASSPLAQWARLLRERGSDQAVGDQLWAHVLTGLDGRRSDLGVRLLSSVRAVDRAPEDLTEFLADVDRPRPGAKDRFLPAVFTTSGLTQEHTKIDIHDMHLQRLGLSRVVTLVQLGEPWPPEDFAVTATTVRPPEGPPVIPPMPGQAAAPPGNGHDPRSGAPAAPYTPQTVRPDPRNVPPAGPPGFG